MSYKNDIHSWIKNFVGKSNPDLNGFAPCPYATQALKENRVDVVIGSTPERDALALKKQDFEDLDVRVFVYNHTMFDADDFSDRIQLINRQLQSQDLLVLDDHPGNPEVVNNVVMNQGEYALMFAQSLSRLEDAARKLAKRGYYDTWPEEYLKDLFAGREDPRSS